MTGPFCVEARGLRKVFRVRRSHRVVTALNGIDLVVPSGALVALVGPDGAGKTTFMRMVCGFLAPDGGSLNVLGADIAREPEPAQANIGYMPQRFGLYEDLTVRENLELYSDLYGVSRTERDERLPHLLAMTELARFETRPAGQLSGGMKQKLGLACALARSPELLLLDEPSVGVDPLSRQELWDVLLGLVREEHLSVMVSTAYMDEAERCDFVYVLDNGAVLAHGAPGELRARAEGRCYRTRPAPGLPARIVQARLADDSALVADAVPEGGAVRFVIHAGSAATEGGRSAGETAEEEARRCGHLILASHNPPKDTACDRLTNGMHVGCEAVRSFIGDVQPELCICGHIHESMAEDSIGKTKIINPGMLGEGGYVVIRFGQDGLSAELKQIR